MRNKLKIYRLSAINYHSTNIEPQCCTPRKTRKLSLNTKGLHLVLCINSVLHSRGAEDTNTPAGLWPGLLWEVLFHLWSMSGTLWARRARVSSFPEEKAGDQSRWGWGRWEGHCWRLLTLDIGLVLFLRLAVGLAHFVTRTPEALGMLVYLNHPFSNWHSAYKVSSSSPCPKTPSPAGGFWDGEEASIRWRVPRVVTVLRVLISHLTPSTTS